ncbi:MAG: hypothetical protein WCK95_29410 [Alphaproteobacteria bacterium]
MGFAKAARRTFAAVLGLAAIGLTLGPSDAQEPYKAQLDALRKAMDKYQDYKVAVRDLYLSTVGCVHYSGEKKDGLMYYAKGAMGVHFVNVTVSGPPDPMKPNVLIYEPVGKELKLVAVEWLVPLTPDLKAKPVLFGQTFMGPMEGHEPLIPKDYVHYDLHAWLFKNNPLGMFAPTNPDVSCKDSDFALLEDPTRMMPGP